MPSALETMQERLTSGWEIFSASSNTVGRSGRGGVEEKNLSVHFLLRRPQAGLLASQDSPDV